MRFRTTTAAVIKPVAEYRIIGYLEGAIGKFNVGYTVACPANDADTGRTLCVYSREVNIPYFPNSGSFVFRDIDFYGRAEVVVHYYIIEAYVFYKSILSAYIGGVGKRGIKIHKWKHYCNTDRGVSHNEI